MSKNVLDVFEERGFLQQVTFEEELRELLATEKVTVYLGIDPTADSLHVGHLMGIMALAHLQRAGHRPLALVGGGTAMIGDPSGRTELREMLSKEKIEENVRGIKKQLDRYLDFTHDRALLLNNADWLLHLNYVEFLREIGVHFSVNRMLTAECFRARMERGLSFIEFNYMLLQAYDYLFLYRKYGCKLQVGGDDQWSNILAGADLIRRVEGGKAYVLTWPLLTTASGKKMGKTEAGSVWLDPVRTSPFAFYQYWRNTDDADVEKLLALYTFLPMEEVKRLGALKGEEINEAKKILAYEVTKLAHGEEAADAAKKAAEALFSGEATAGKMPTTQVEATRYPEGLPLLDLLVLTGLVPSKKEGRRLIEQKGIALNRQVVSDQGLIISLDDFRGDGFLLRKGKKTYHRVEVV
ncbi:MAG TPA: tyrosine--tRNA ligase [Firmicutes bacterium]|nr:tyrosine--tRNA ligase [Bacillota bacterium]